jgi:hypothetical protein
MVLLENDEVVGFRMSQKLARGVPSLEYLLSEVFSSPVLNS